MAWMQEIDLADHGVQVPTHGHWVPVPGSPFEVMSRGQDLLGIFYVRINPAYAHLWNEFTAMLEAGA